MYKLPRPDNVLYLELVGKQPPLGTRAEVVSLRPATGMCYIRTTGTMSTSRLLCDPISVTAEAPYLCISPKIYLNRGAAQPPFFSSLFLSFFFLLPLCTG